MKAPLNRGAFMVSRNPSKRNFVIHSSVGSRGTDVWALQVWLGVSGSGPASEALLAEGPTGSFDQRTTAALSSGPFTKDLSLGSTGPQVTVLQRFLARDPALYQGRANGTYDQPTAQAVQAFQLIAGIDVPPPATTARSTHLPGRS